MTVTDAQKRMGMTEVKGHPAWVTESHGRKFLTSCLESFEGPPEEQQSVCHCYFSCPRCGQWLCGGEYLIDLASGQGIVTSDLQGDLHGDQAMTACHQCGLPLWAAAETGAYS